MITIEALTLTYPNGKGVFDIHFSLKKGDVMGYLGPNGAGKTTTIRALMGFMRPKKGRCTINGLDCVKDAPTIQKILGYIPGEISFFDGMNGEEFLRFMCHMRGSTYSPLGKELLDVFELDLKGPIKKFSKGMKQKLGIIAACMHDPEVLILDEPTSGLDPLMKNRFIEYLQNKKREGKTILLSSHSFEEVERLCDTVLIIKEGRIIKESDIATLKKTQRKIFVITSDNLQNFVRIMEQEQFETIIKGDHIVEVSVPGSDIDLFIKTLAMCSILDIEMRDQSLEHAFMKLYAKQESSYV